MENLNAENIINEIQSLIKALKDCGGWVKRGNGEGWFNHEILADALALITSQEQRIKELEAETKRLESLCVSKDIIIGDLSKENERLRADCAKGANALIEEMQKNRTIEADTVRKMQERVREMFLSNNTYYASQVFAYIDQIAKEMIDNDGG